MTEDERLALRHSMYISKLDNYPGDKNVEKKELIEQGLLRNEPEILDHLKSGYDEFELNVAKRIMTETPSKVLLNNCPKCHKLTRTPYARQCRFCGHNWHDINVALFKLDSSFQLTGRHFFLLGQITKGQVKHGDFIDLTMLGLNKKPRVDAIEFALKRQDGKVWEDIGLGTNELTEEEKIYVKKIGSFGTPFDIVNKR